MTIRETTMTDTIELLETIGKDASLRRASGEDLACTLAGMNASEALRQAAASGDACHLAQELGHMNLQSNHGVTQIGPEEDEFEPASSSKDDEDVAPGEEDEPTVI